MTLTDGVPWGAGLLALPLYQVGIGSEQPFERTRNPSWLRVPPSTVYNAARRYYDLAAWRSTPAVVYADPRDHPRCSRAPVLRCDGHSTECCGGPRPHPDAAAARADGDWRAPRDCWYVPLEESFWMSPN